MPVELTDEQWRTVEDALRVASADLKREARRLAGRGFLDIEGGAEVQMYDNLIHRAAAMELIYAGMPHGR